MLRASRPRAPISSPPGRAARIEPSRTRTSILFRRISFILICQIGVLQITARKRGSKQSQGVAGLLLEQGRRTWEHAALAPLGNDFPCSNSCSKCTRWISVNVTTGIEKVSPLHSPPPLLSLPSDLHYAAERALARVSRTHTHALSPAKSPSDGASALGVSFIYLFPGKEKKY